MLYEPLLRDNLTKIATTYAAHTGMSMATVSRRFCGDSRFFSRMDDGCTFSVRFYDRAVSHFADVWPPGLAWPKGVEKPSRSQIATAKETALTTRTTQWS